RPSGVGGPAGAPRTGLRRNARRQGPRALPPCTCRGGSGAAPDTPQDEEAEDHQHSADRGRPELRAGLGEAAALGLRPGRLLQLRKGAGHLGRLGGLAPVLAVLAVVAAGARFLAVVRGGRRLHVGLSGHLGALVVRRLLGGRGLRRLLAAVALVAALPAVVLLAVVTLALVATVVLVAALVRVLGLGRGLLRLVSAVVAAVAVAVVA